MSTSHSLQSNTSNKANITDEVLSNKIQAFSRAYSAKFSNFQGLWKKFAGFKGWVAILNNNHPWSNKQNLRVTAWVVIVTLPVEHVNLQLLCNHIDNVPINNAADLQVAQQHIIAQVTH